MFTVSDRDSSVSLLSTGGVRTPSLRCSLYTQSFLQPTEESRGQAIGFRGKAMPGSQIRSARYSHHRSDVDQFDRNRPVISVGFRANTADLAHRLDAVSRNVASAWLSLTPATAGWFSFCRSFRRHFLREELPRPEAGSRTRKSGGGATVAFGWYTANN